MIKLKDILEAKDTLVNQIEQDILGFDFIQPKYYSSERKNPGYKRELNIAMSLVNKFGISKAKEIYKTVGAYTATGYGRMNKSLRADKLPAKVNLIDQYIDIAPNYTGSELYRGIGKELYQTIISSKSKEFIDKAFMSATSDYTTAEEFARRTGKGAILILTGNLNKAAQAPLPMAMAEGEAEYIFPRNTKLQISKIDGDEIYVLVH